MQVERQITALGPTACFLLGSFRRTSKTKQHPGWPVFHTKETQGGGQSPCRHARRPEASSWTRQPTPHKLLKLLGDILQGLLRLEGCRFLQSQPCPPPGCTVHTTHVWKSLPGFIDYLANTRPNSPPPNLPNANRGRIPHSAVEC